MAGNPSAAASSTVNRSTSAIVPISFRTAGDSRATTCSTKYSTTGSAVRTRRSSMAGRASGSTRTSASAASRLAAGQPPVAACSRSASRRSPVPAPSVVPRGSSIASRNSPVSSREKARSAPVSDRTWPWIRSRSIGNGRSVARRQHDVQPGRRLAAEGGDQPAGGISPRERLEVVEDQDQVARQRPLDGIADGAGEGLRPATLIGRRLGSSPQIDDVAEQAPDRGCTQPDGPDDAGGQRREIAIDGRHRVPGQRLCLSPHREQRRLAEARRGHDRREPAGSCLRRAAPPVARGG